MTIHLVDNVADFLLGEETVDRFEGHAMALRQGFGKKHTARGRVETNHALNAIFAGLRDAGDNLGVQRNSTNFKSLMHFGHIRQHHPFARFAATVHRQIVKTKHHVLRRHDDRLTVCRRQDVVGGHHQNACFQLRLKAQRNVDSHLVTVKVGVKG